MYLTSTVFVVEAISALLLFSWAAFRACFPFSPTVEASTQLRQTNNLDCKDSYLINLLSSQPATVTMSVVAAGKRATLSLYVVKGVAKLPSGTTSLIYQLYIQQKLVEYIDLLNTRRCTHTQPRSGAIACKKES